MSDMVETDVVPNTDLITSTNSPQIIEASEIPSKKQLGRVWRQDGKTMILVYDEDGVGRWLGGLDWMPIEFDYPEGKQKTVRIFINGCWWRTYETELEIQTMEQIYGFPFLCHAKSKKNVSAEKMQEQLLHMFNSYFCAEQNQVLRLSAFAFLHGTETGLVEQNREILAKELEEAQLWSVGYCEKEIYDRAVARAVDAYWLRRVLNARRNIGLKTSTDIQSPQG